MGLMTDAASRKTDDKPKTVSKNNSSEHKDTSVEISRYQDINKDIKISRQISPREVTQAEDTDAVLDVVTQVGKESSPLRVTPYENERLDAVIYMFKSKKKLRTDKTEIVRCALNYILDDYDKRGDSSLLVDMITRLRSYRRR